jgi:asparagine synthase (glutamine-hydrolysing)
MCGIAGLVHLDGAPVSAITIKQMTDAIAHRGPDGEGHWIDGHVGLGHRRLAIIDLSPAGHQPMISPDGRYVLTYNGEVYNYRELRIDLESLGHQFRSNTDSEVVLHALAEWGMEALGRFNGMFAFGLLDRSTRRLYLARDRYGIKPLYWSLQSGRFAFASENKALATLPGFAARLDTQALQEYLTFQNIFTDRTLLAGVHLLPAGHYITMDIMQRSALPQVFKYWDYQFREPETGVDQGEYVEELARLFTQAVQRQLVADVELGAYLSGGIDSGSITAIASGFFPNLKSFTCGFDLSSASGLELGFDERSNAEALSAQYRTEHYEMVLKAGDMQRCLPLLAWHLEEPRVGQSYPNFYAAKLASKFVKVVLSGTGGDELFGGYPWRYYGAASSQSFVEFVYSYYNYWQRLLDDKELRSLFGSLNSSHTWVDTRTIFQDVFSSHDNALKTPADLVNHSLYFEAKTFLQGLLIVDDKLSMAHGLESRVPFLDNDLVDFATRCPVGMKLNRLVEMSRIDENLPGSKRGDYAAITNDGKQILRDAMKRFIPPTIADAKKQGFAAPDASWFKGESIDYVRATLYSRNARIGDYLDLDILRSLVDEHLSGTRNRRLLVWSLLYLEEWIKIYL